MTDDILNKIDEKLDEQNIHRKIDPKKVYKKWYADMSKFSKTIDNTFSDFETMDDQIGGSTMIDKIEKKYKVLKKALSDFSNEVYGATPEYGEGLLYKGKK